MDETSGAAETSQVVRRPRLSGQFGWVSMGQLFGALINAATLALVARWAGPDGFAAVGIALSLIVVVQTVTDCGLPTFILRERAAASTNPQIRRALQINSLTAAAMAILLGGIFLAAAAFFQPLYIELLPLAVWAAAERNTDTWLAIPLADGEARWNAILRVVRRGATLLGMIALSDAGAAPLLAFSMASTLVALCTNAFAHSWVTRRMLPLMERPKVRPILNASFPYWVNSAATQMRNLDTLIVAAVAGGPQVAFYSAASKVTGPLRILPASLALLLIPAAARSGVNNLRSMRASISLLLGLLLPIYAGIAIAAPRLIPATLGVGFTGAVLPVQIVCTGYILAAAAAIFGSILQGLERGAVVARVAVLTTGIALVGILGGSVALGAVGASIALVASYLVQAAALALILRAAVRDAEGANDRKASMASQALAE